MSNKDFITSNEIQKRIYTLRDKHVMLDTDLSDIYGVETKRLNEQVKRNIERFPEEFMFQLTSIEMDELKSQYVSFNDNNFLRSQFATLENGRGKHRKYMPYAFTEQGVAMLSAVLRSETAINVSIQIMNAFVSMRRFLLANAQVFQRLETLELRQIETDKKINRVFTAIEDKSILPKQGIFYDGQVFDAWQFVSDLIRSAKKSIVLIDNYIDDSVLSLFTKREKSVPVTLLTKNISRQLETDKKKFNEQYPPLEIREFKISHDRFLIIDETDLYHFGASLKDLGKKWFAFSKMDSESVTIVKAVEELL